MDGSPYVDSDLVTFCLRQFQNLIEGMAVHLRSVGEQVIEEVLDADPERLQAVHIGDARRSMEAAKKTSNEDGQQAGQHE